MDDKRILSIREKVFAEFALAEDSLESGALLHESERYRTSIPLFKDALLRAVKALLMLHTDEMPESSRLLDSYGQTEIDREIKSDVNINEVIAKLEEAEKDCMEHPLDISKESVKDLDTCYKQIENFLVKARKYIRKTLRTTQEVKKRTFVRKIIMGATAALIVVVVLVIVILYFLSLKNGLTGSYFSGQNFEKLIETRRDKKIDFDWGLGNVIANHADYVSIRWTGKIKAPKSGKYTFITRSDDGARLWIDGKIIIDDWKPHAEEDHRAKINLTEGYHNIKVEYFESEIMAAMKLSWVIPGTQRPKIIAPSHLRKSP